MLEKRATDITLRLEQPPNWKGTMSRTIDEGFRDFLTTLTPSSSESEAAARHRASIKARLDTNCGVLRFFRTGSFGSGTSISGYSDVHYFASLKEKPSSIQELLCLRFEML